MKHGKFEMIKPLKNFTFQGLAWYIFRYLPRWVMRELGIIERISIWKTKHVYIDPETADYQIRSFDYMLAKHIEPEKCPLWRNQEGAVLNGRYKWIATFKTFTVEELDKIYSIHKRITNESRSNNPA